MARIQLKKKCGVCKEVWVLKEGRNYVICKSCKKKLDKDKKE